MKTGSIIIILCIISFVLSACDSTTPQATDTLKPLLTATNTTIPTVVASPTATPDLFVGFNKCFTWREARENCVVTLDDLTSGRLVDYARKVTKPFPADAFGLRIQRWDVVANKMGSTYQFIPTPLGVVDEVTQALLDIESNYGVNNKVFSDPRSPVGDQLFFWVKGDGTSNLNFDILAIVTKVKNMDGSDGYYTNIQFPCVDPSNGSICAPLNGEDPTVTMFDEIEKMAYIPPVYDAEYTYSGKKGWGGYFF